MSNGLSGTVLWVDRRQLGSVLCLSDYMNNDDQLHKKRFTRPPTLGFAYCILSAIGYTMVNIVLRRLDELGTDPMWVICVKESVTVIVVGAWLLLRVVFGRRVSIQLKVIAMLVAVGIATQFLGNVNMQWSFGVVGLAITIPLSFGAMLICGALGGWFFLGERVSTRKALAIVVLVCGIALLSMGANTASGVVAALSTTKGPFWSGVAIAAVCLVGTVFGLLTIVIRRASLANVPIELILVTITGMGVVCLAPLCLARLGVKGLLATPPDVFGLMLLAGLLNLLSFLAIIKGLELTTVVYANIINSSQVAIAALAGVVVFGEPASSWLIFGMFATVLGIVLINKPVRRDETDFEM